MDSNSKLLLEIKELKKKKKNFKHTLEIKRVGVVPNCLHLLKGHDVWISKQSEYK